MRGEAAGNIKKRHKTAREQKQEQMLTAANRRRDRERKVDRDRAANEARQPGYSVRKVKKKEKSRLVSVLMETASQLSEVLGRDVDVTVGRRIDKAQVHSPTVAGGIDFVGKAFDQIEEMRTGRKTRDGRDPPKITKQEYNVARSYKRSFDTLSTSLGGSMDFDKVRGGTWGGRVHSEEESKAIGIINRIEKVVGRTDAAIFVAVIGFGLTVEECAAQMYGVTEAMKPEKRYVQHVEQRLIEALREVAAVLYPERKSEEDGRSRGESIVAWSAPKESAA